MKLLMILSRGAKRVFVACVYLTILTLLIAGTYYSFFKAPETCFDGKENQDEQGIDCGGSCQAVCKETVIGRDLEITEITFVAGDNSQYDVLTKIYNPNDEIGASSFAYTVSLKDAAGNVLASRSGKSYSLPQENKYILELNLAAPSVPATASLRISEVEWARFSGFQEKPAINIYQKRYSPIASGAGFSEAAGLLSNESPYDFRSIVVKVILRDTEGKPLALNSTEMRTVRSHEERAFNLIWPRSFPGTVEKVEMEVDADVYHSENFMRQFLPGGKFQDFTPSPGY